MAAVPVVFSEALNVSLSRHMDLCSALCGTEDTYIPTSKINGRFSAPLSGYPRPF
jgi:hypothetical protein